MLSTTSTFPLLVQVLNLLLVSDSEFEAPRAALRERYSSPVTSTCDATSTLLSQPTTPRLALVSIGVCVCGFVCL